MLKRFSQTRVIIFFGLVLLGGLLYWGAQLLKTEPLDRLPPNSFEDLTGSEISLSGLIGKPVILNLWATWCAPCRRELPMMAELAAQHPEVHFVFANQKESAEQIRRYLESQGLRLVPVLLDKKGDLAMRSGSPGLPTTLFFNAKGELIKTQLGEINSVELFNTLRDLQR